MTGIPVSIVLAGQGPAVGRVCEGDLAPDSRASNPLDDGCRVSQLSWSYG